MADVRLGDAVTTGRPSRRVIAVLVIELLVLVASLTTAVVLAASDSSSSSANNQASAGQGSPQDRAAAVAAAEAFVINVQDYPPFDQTGYEKNVIPMLTTKAKAATASQLEAYKPVLDYYRKICASAKGQAATVCKAYEAKPQVSIAFAALAAYDGSTATVLVPHLVTYINGGASQKFEFQVTLDKIDGKWLIDTYCTANASSGADGATNSASCTS